MLNLKNYYFLYFLEETDGDIEEYEPLSMFDNEDGTESTTERIDRDDSDNLHDTSLMFRNGHISLFGEIIHDMESSNTDEQRSSPTTTGSHKNVNEQNIRKQNMPYC